MHWSGLVGRPDDRRRRGPHPVGRRHAGGGRIGHLAGRVGDHVGEGLPPGSDAYQEPRDVDYASANGLLVSRRAWDVVGGFDERYFPAYFEDVDLCLALAAHGFRTRYEPWARVIHRGSQSTSNVYREFLLTRNQRKLVEKWGSALDRFEPRPPKAVRARVRRRRGAGAQQGSRRGRAPPRTERPRARRLMLSCVRRPLTRRPQNCEPSTRPTWSNAWPIETRRVTTLETYLSGLWEVRLRRWVGGRISRGRS